MLCYYVPIVLPLLLQIIEMPCRRQLGELDPFKQQHFISGLRKLTINVYALLFIWTIDVYNSFHPKHAQSMEINRLKISNPLMKKFYPVWALYTEFAVGSGNKLRIKSDFSAATSKREYRFTFRS